MTTHRTATGCGASEDVADLATAITGLGGLAARMAGMIEPSAATYLDKTRTAYDMVAADYAELLSAADFVELMGLVRPPRAKSSNPRRTR